MAHQLEGSNTPAHVQVGLLAPGPHREGTRQERNEDTSTGLGDSEVGRFPSELCTSSLPPSIETQSVVHRVRVAVVYWSLSFNQNVL